MKFGTWKVQTLMDNPKNNQPEQRTAIVARELKRYTINIVALSKTQCVGEGQLKKQDGAYTFFWTGAGDDEQWIHGAGFTIKTEIINQLSELPVSINEWLRLKLAKNQHATLMRFNTAPICQCLFWTFEKCVFEGHDIKRLVYQISDIPALLYVAEIWVTYSRHLKALEQYHPWCLHTYLI